MIPKVCPICGNEFQARPKQTTCSYPCRNHALRQIRLLQLPSPEERFWARVQRTEGCWLWLGSTDKFGYGCIQIEHRRMGPHRYSYELHFGLVPEGLCVLHECDNPSCVRPDHLFLGTLADNNADRSAKGRSATGEKSGAYLHRELFQGEKNPAAKLQDSDVLEIRRLYETEKFSLRQLANQFGMSKSMIGNIISGKSWQCIKS